jgi:predicted metalloprotease with PDZ domain
VTEIDDFIAWTRSSRRHLVVDLIRGETQASEQIAFDLAGFTLPPGLTAASDSAEPGVAVVNFVAPGGQAEKAGFQNGDRIHSVDETQPDLSWEVERDGQLLKLPK